MKYLHLLYCFVMLWKFGSLLENEQVLKRYREELQITEDDQACSQRNLHMNPALPFIVLEPLIDVIREDGEQIPTQSIWCEGMMFSEAWGIAPPTCLFYNSKKFGTTKERINIGKFYFNFIEEKNNHNSTYLAILKTFQPPGFTQFDQNMYCNFIGLFQIRNFRFNFNNVILLQQAHDRRDMSEIVSNCRIVGAKLNMFNEEDEINLKSITFPLIDTSDYCNLRHGECSPLQCKNYNFNVTYVKFNLPKLRIDQYCQLDRRYNWGASLMCQSHNKKWIYVGMATWEMTPACNYQDDKDSYQGFVRVDAYLDWIVKTIVDNGGFEQYK